MIKGFFDPDIPWPVPIVRLLLSLPDAGMRLGNVRFNLDTGADASMLHPTDALSVLQFSAEDLRELYRWGSPHTVLGIGGIGVYYRLQARYTFMHEDGTLQYLDLPILVSPPTPETERLPSLLGWDVLRHFRLFFDWESRLVTLNSQGR